MLNHTWLAAALLACATPSVPAPVQEEVPTSLSAFKPHEVVEAFTAEARSLALTPEQLAQLDSLHVAVRDERHRWTATPGNKAHKGVKMKPMISGEKAYTDALAVLTPAQRGAVIKRFNDPDYVPMVTSLASQVPSSLEGLKPHEIVQAFSAEAEALELSEDQMHDLQALHLAVRDERHRYTSRTPAGKAHRYQMMEPMISKRRAYNDAMSYLTPEQRESAMKRFNAPGYKAPALAQ